MGKELDCINSGKHRSEFKTLFAEGEGYGHIVRCPLCGWEQKMYWEFPDISEREEYAVYVHCHEGVIARVKELLCDDKERVEFIKKNSWFNWLKR